MMQVVNETNSMILQKETKPAEMNWSRNVYLLNRVMKAVRDISTKKVKNNPFLFQ